MNEVDTYWDWIKNEMRVVFPSLRDTPYHKIHKRRFAFFWLPHIHKPQFISDRCAGTVSLCLKCGAVLVERWSSEKTQIIGYINLFEAFEIAPLGELPKIVHILPNGEVETLWQSLNLGRWQNMNTYEIIENYTDPFDVDPQLIRCKTQKQILQEILSH